VRGDFTDLSKLLLDHGGKVWDNKVRDCAFTAVPSSRGCHAEGLFADGAQRLHGSHEWWQPQETCTQYLQHSVRTAPGPTMVVFKVVLLRFSSLLHS